MQQRSQPAHGAGSASSTVSVNLTVNGTRHSLSLDPRTSLLDLLREHLDLTGSKRAATTASAAPARCCSMAAASYRASRLP